MGNSGEARISHTLAGIFQLSFQEETSKLFVLPKKGISKTKFRPIYCWENA
jgi:hypothetical protein